MLEKLAELGIDIEEKRAKLEKFMLMFLEYNNNINLVSKNDAKFLFEKHIYDSLAFNLFFSQNKKKKIKLLDIGTGGGFPSLPIAVCFDNIDVTAVDSTLKKIKFIEYIKQELELKNIHPICKRAEELDFKEKFDYCTSRAMAELRIILEYAIPYLKINGIFLAYKSIKTDEEIKNAQNSLKILNSEVIKRIDYSLPIEEENKRILVAVRKIAKTPAIYPRRNGLITKKPL